jgi:GNAT superfamily N-acetyltransferase
MIQKCKFLAILMASILGYLIHLFKLPTKVASPSPLKIDDYSEVITITNDTWNRIPDGCILREYYDSDNNKIGYIRYKVKVGQVGLFFINEEYRNRGLGKQILNRTMDHMRQSGATGVWAVTTRDHEFWSNVYNKSFKWRDPAHPSVTGDGYYMWL